MESDEFDFSELGDEFGFPLPAGLMQHVMQGIIASSRLFSALYREHLANGFSEEQALRMVLSAQRDLVHGASIIGATVAKSITKPKADD